MRLLCDIEIRVRVVQHQSTGICILPVTITRHKLHCQILHQTTNNTDTMYNTIEHMQSM